jgi:hypothetical protein
MRRRLLVITLTSLAAWAAGFVAAVPANASPGSPVLADCQSHDALTHTYSVTQLRNALSTMPSDMLEYTDCHDVIQRALNNALAGRASDGGATGSGGSSLSTPFIVIIVVLVLAAGTLGAIAVRRRRGP